MTEPSSPPWDPNAAGATGPNPYAAVPPGSPPPPPPPPPPGYPPVGGYAPGYQTGPVPPPPGYASADDKTWALVAHFGGAAGMFLIFGFGGWIAPLIALLTKGNQSPTVRAHAVNALNFQLVWSGVALIGYITACFVIGFVIFPIAAIIGIIFGIIGGLRANEGQLYKYPMSFTIVK